MTPDEIINAANKMGEKDGIPLVMTRTTLLRYEMQGLISVPSRGGRGRGGGRWTEYPKGTAKEVYAAWCYMQGHYGGKEFEYLFGKPPKMTPIAIKKIREAYLEKIEMDEKTANMFGLEAMSAKKRKGFQKKWVAIEPNYGIDEESRKAQEEYDQLTPEDMRKMEVEDNVNKEAVRIIKEALVVIYQSLLLHAENLLGIEA